ncbi:MAG: hypothetical protein CMC13_12785 [Flavobacteriaceae bacterium]|nr:hypothetical protein [Flavobacteriaceae bacterium]|tara:strand:- start:626 stop:2086 length:1461 start_codon:yes stop_codon:yes gene_type:complete
MLAQKKYIKKVVIDIETSSMEQALDIKQRTETIFGSSFYELLEEIIEELLLKYPKIIHIKLNNISTEIDINKFENSFRFRSDLRRNIRAQIEEQLSKVSAYKKLQNNGDHNSKDYEGFLFYLTQGRYPWWQKFDEILPENQFEKWLDNDDFIEKLNIRLSNSNTLDRLLLTTEYKILTNILFKFLDSPKTNNLGLTGQHLAGTPHKIQFAFYKALLSYSLAKDIKIFGTNLRKLDTENFSENEFKKTKILLGNAVDILADFSGLSSKKIKTEVAAILTHLRSNKSLKKSTQNELQFDALMNGNNNPENLQQDFSNDTSKSTENEYYVLNAGLIILHPFFERFFKTLGIYTDGSIKKEHWNTATHVLHYLATKEDHPHEHQLIFPKYLCGIPQNTPIHRFHNLSEAQKDECETLLQAVLQHWSGLKTNTTDLLRSEFLTREGKLSLSADLEKLFITRKAQDLLLDNIPWTIGIAQLPWKKQLIYTEW